MGEMFDVVSVGSATVDVLVKSTAFKVRGKSLCEIYGGKMEAEEVVMTVGGSATNTAVSFARKELKTACVSEIGKDWGGEMVKRELKKEGVETRYIVEEEEEKTAIGVLLISGEGERSAVVYRGASAMLEKNDFPWDIRTRWLHIGSLGGNVKLVKQLINWAQRRGVRVSFNPGEEEIRKRERVVRLLAGVEILFVNREEATRLLEVDFQDEGIWRREHCPWGAKVTVITDGKNGGKMCWEGQCLFWRGERGKVVDTTGAGDALASGMVSGVLYGLGYEQALEWGKRNARGVMREMGAKKGLLSLAEVKG